MRPLVGSHGGKDIGVEFGQTMLEYSNVLAISKVEWVMRLTRHVD
jgi:hypothetical protein